MRSAPAQSRSNEDGFALVEVLVSALVVVIAGAAILTLLQATTRAAGDERRHSAAFAIAQEDQARLRSMRISSLNGLKQKWSATLDGTKYEVESLGAFVNNSSGDATCTNGQTSADYVRITSKVKWEALGKRPPIVIQSIVSPSNGSLDPGHGTLTVSAINAAGLPLPGVQLSGTGPGTFSGTTDENGCATFADLAAGNYTMTPSAPGLIDPAGKAPAATTVGVTASGTVTRQLQYDRPGMIEASFKYRVGSSGEFKVSSANSIAVFNSGMTGPAYTTVGSPAAAIKSGQLFPFTSPYAVYAGSCSSNNPNPNSEPTAPGAAFVGSVVVPPGSTTSPATVTVQVPALNLVVKKSGTALSGARVKITGSCSFSREYTTTATGTLPDPGLPYGTYTVCANTTGTAVRKTVSNVTVQNPTAGTSLEIDLGSGTTSGSCP